MATKSEPLGQVTRTDGGVVLDVRDLSVRYTRSSGNAPSILDQVSMTIKRGEIIGLAGESGSGKSTLVESILRLLEPPRYVSAGEVLFMQRGESKSVDLLQLPERTLRGLRWRSLAYIPQGSMNSLNPVLRIESQIVDAMIDHGRSQREASERVPVLLNLVGLEPRAARLYPHQLSGGMKQRAVIASAISMDPDIVIADEITTGLDVNVQRVILQTLMDIRRKLGVAVLFVSHDMAVHAQIDDRLALLYAGRVAEVGDVREVFKEPLHPYTRGLIGSIPAIGDEDKRLTGIPGVAPSPTNWPEGCRFHPRCPRAMAVCSTEVPRLSTVKGEHATACHLYTEPPGGE